MKIEVLEIKPGKEYLTRDGQRARIYAVGAGGDYPVHGAMLEEDGSWSHAEWTSSGAFRVSGVGTSSCDLVSEYKEPKPRLALWRNTRDGTVKALRSDAVFIPIHARDFDLNWERISLKDLEGFGE